MEKQAALYLSLRPLFLPVMRLQYHDLSEGPEMFAKRLRRGDHGRSFRNPEGGEAEGSSVL